MKQAARAECKESGIAMEVYTDLPGMQFYIGNFIDNEREKRAVFIRSGAASAWRLSIIRMPAIRAIFRVLF